MATPRDNVVPLTGNPLIDGLTWGAAWQFDGGPQTLTYSLSLNDNPRGGAWTAELSAAARRALDEWSKVANLSFLELGSGTVYDQSPADLALILTGDELQSKLPGLAGLGIPPSPFFVDAAIIPNETRGPYPQPEGDIGLDNYYSGFNYLESGGIGFFVMLHEIGHALGLKHTDDNYAGHPTFASLGIADLDSNLYTVMSYTNAAGQRFGSNQIYQNAATPMPLDILAIQHIYGPNTSYRTGNDTYMVWDNNHQVSTIWDAGGNDTLAAGFSYNGGTLDLREGHYSGPQSATAIAYNTVIENATGSEYGDTLIGNAADNHLDGRYGNDTMTGGAGNDTYGVDSSNDFVMERPAEGVDTIITSVSLTLPDNVENLTLLGWRSVNGTGNALNNIITGNTAAGTLAGDIGDDIYIIESPKDSLRLSGDRHTAGAGGHTITWSQMPHFALYDGTGDGLVDAIDIHYDGEESFDLAIGGSNIGQNLAIGHYADAGDRPYAFFGRHPLLEFDYNYGTDQAVGNFEITEIDIDYSGATPVLHRLGLSFELYSETWTGEAIYGHFNYNWADDPIHNEILETPNEGRDEVRTSVSFTLPDNVEVLTLTGSANIDGNGNSLGNQLGGNSGSNQLRGLDGNDVFIASSGNDTLDGGSGSDEVRFAGHRADYAMQLGPSGAYTVSGSDGISSLAAIERVTFGDGTDALPSGIVGLGGTATQGQTLTASNTLTDADGIGQLHYQWRADGNPIVGATGSTLRLTDAQVGKVITVIVSYTDGHGTAESALSAATAPVANVNDAPRGSLQVVGTPTAGQMLTTINRLTDADGLGTPGLQWQSRSDNANWSPIADATASSFQLTADRIGQQVRIVASYTDGHGAAESVASAPITVYDNFPGRTADLLAYSWKSHVALDEVVVGTSSSSQSTGSAGSASLAGITDTNLALTASRTIPAAETTATAQAVNLQDAIAVLKLVVGLDINGAGRPLSPYQAYAADFDGDGAVNLNDAIKLLKHVVGLDAPHPAWTFFNEATTPAPANLMQPGSVPPLAADLSAASTSIHVGLVGVLRGDVDGSFAGAPTATAIDLAQPMYFQNLSATHDLNPSQFGIYTA